MGQFDSLNLQELAPAQVYDTLTSLIVPRPVALVSTVSSSGVGNLAPFSFLTIGGVNPPSLVFCPVAGLQGEKKETLRNVEDIGEFVVNLVSESMIGGIDAVSKADSSIDDWEASGFTSLASLHVRPARVLQSPAQFECRVHEIVFHGSGPNSACYVIGEALAVHIDASLRAGLGKGIVGLGGPGRYVLADGGKLPNLSPTLQAAEPSGDRTR